MVKLTQISLIAVVAIGVGALLIPGGIFTPAALAYSHHHHHHHVVKVSQHVDQSNLCSNSDCTNTNSQDVSVTSHHSSVFVRQHVDQSNVCDTSDCSNSNSQSVSVS